MKKLAAIAFLFFLVVLGLSLLADVVADFFRPPTAMTELSSAIRFCALAYLLVNLVVPDSDKEGES